ncbi:type II toxin-antitoxin system HicB family antitoxin [Dictyobacter vulcani]|uniref:type II toxin-antitoxin system HicB family antitoxin n=1 Tax=Dictyobacter vulcani TaxID=2607529 RepID=UPI0035312B1C
MYPNPKHYSMIIHWDNNDQIYVVSVPELPGCMTHGQTYEVAFFRLMVCQRVLPRRQA